MSKILVVVAHPDDEVLACGGTVLRKIDEGDQVFCLVLSDGVTSRYSKIEDSVKEKIHERKLAFIEVSKLIGFEKQWLHEFPDNRFDSVDLLDIVKVVEEIVNEVKPNIIFTHFEGDLNVDHRFTFQAVLTACRPMNGRDSIDIYSAEVPSSTEWTSPFTGGNNFRPNVFIDIEKTINKKIKAMEIYSSEIQDYPHPRSPESLKLISQRWGIVSGLKNAEAFILIRKIE